MIRKEPIRLSSIYSLDFINFDFGNDSVIFSCEDVEFEMLSTQKSTTGGCIVGWTTKSCCNFSISVNEVVSGILPIF